MVPNSVRLVSSWKRTSLMQGQTQTKGRWWRDRDTEKATEDEGRDWSEASTSQRLPGTHQKLGESTGLSLPHGPQKELTLLTPCFWTSSLQNYGVILSHPVVDNLFQKQVGNLFHQETNTDFPLCPPSTSCCRQALPLPLSFLLS